MIRKPGICNDRRNRKYMHKFDGKINPFRGMEPLKE
jgi:hypothetical protein